MVIAGRYFFHVHTIRYARRTEGRLIIVATPILQSRFRCHRHKYATTVHLVTVGHAVSLHYSRAA